MAELAKKSGRTTPKKAKKVTTAQQWKKKQTFELEVPSGNVCLVRKPDGIKAFLGKGGMPNSLMPLVMGALDEKSDGEINMQDIMKDPEKFQDLMEMVDRLTLETVVEPALAPVPMRTDGNGGVEPVPLAERDDSVLYVDEIDLEDKLVIMGWAMGGLKDLETFRKSTTEHVAALADGQDLPESPLIVSGDQSPL
jgi:hypothetical protein